MVDINTKVCTKCNEELPATTEFFYKRDNVFGLHAYCKKCFSRRNKQYYKNKREYILKQVSAYRKTDRGRELKNIWHASWKKTAAGRKVNKKYKQSQKGREAARRCSSKIYYNNRLSSIISSHLYRSLKENKSNRHCFDILPYSLDELKSHIEKLWLPGMTWDNYGKYGWHIDHIKPVSFFDKEEMKCSDSDIFQECWSLKNLQPLWAEQNLKKGNKLNYVCEKYSGGI